MLRGTALTGASFAAGNMFGARVRSNGMVEVYKGTTLMGTRDASGWSFINQTGYVDLRVNNGPAFLLDDFGGGTVAGGIDPVTGPALAHAAPKVLYKVRVERSTELINPGPGQTYRISYYARAQLVAIREIGARTSLQFIHTDHLSSMSVASNTAGAQVGTTQRFYPFGMLRLGSSTQPFTDAGFTGQIADACTRLMHYDARYYDPFLHRFINADTIAPEPGNPQALNRYSYAYNRPLSFVDPSEHCGIDVNRGLGQRDCTFDDFVNMSLSERIS